MQPTKTTRTLLGLSSILAIGIGASILLAPTTFHASNGITIGQNPSLLSEVRAPGAALLVLGAMMLVGAFVRSFTFASTSIAMAVYLSYGSARLLSIGLDGMPAPGLVIAMGIELLLGGLCAMALVRSVRLKTVAGRQHPTTNAVREPS